MSKTPLFKFALVLFALGMNGLFYFLGYPDTGAKALYEDIPALFVLIVMVLLYALVGSLYFFIKKK